MNDFAPHAVIVYKGAGITAGLVLELRNMGTLVVNVFPDCSPHPHGRSLRNAMGCYDLVISTKPFHPALWQSVYGYDNPCVWVPHGYDPGLHFWPHPPSAHTYDVALCCQWRPEYHNFMMAFAEALGDSQVSVAIAGNRWPEHQSELPSRWKCVGSREGRAYGDFVRAARIVIAPVNRQMVIGGVRQPGDEDTARTYELAAAHCFFLHQRTDYVSTIYDEQHEVPFWNDGTELATLVRRWLPDEAGRRSMAARAHARAVPAYSIAHRAARVLGHIERMLEARRPREDRNAPEPTSQLSSRHG
jgi:spore maturation protein CgeB